MSPDLHHERTPALYDDVLPRPVESRENVSEQPVAQTDIREGLMLNLLAAKAAQSAIGTTLTEHGVPDVTKHPAYKAADKAVNAADLAVYAFHGIDRANNRPEAYEE